MGTHRQRRSARIALLLVAACARPESIEIDGHQAEVRIRSVERRLIVDRLASVPQDDADRALRI
jgi:hypothetical protein